MVLAVVVCLYVRPKTIIYNRTRKGKRKRKRKKRGREKMFKGVYKDTVLSCVWTVGDVYRVEGWGRDPLLILVEIEVDLREDEVALLLEAAHVEGRETLLLGIVEDDLVVVKHREGDLVLDALGLRVTGHLIDLEIRRRGVDDTSLLEDAGGEVETTVVSEIDLDHGHLGLGDDRDISTVDDLHLGDDAPLETEHDVGAVVEEDVVDLGEDVDGDVGAVEDDEVVGHGGRDGDHSRVPLFDHDTTTVKGTGSHDS